MTAPARQFQAPLGPQIVEGALVKLAGSPLLFRVRRFDVDHVVLGYPRDGRYAGRWCSHLISPAQEDANV